MKRKETQIYTLEQVLSQLTMKRVKNTLSLWILMSRMNKC